MCSILLILQCWCGYLLPEKKFRFENSGCDFLRDTRTTTSTFFAQNVLHKRKGKRWHGTEQQGFLKAKNGVHVCSVLPAMVLPQFLVSPPLILIGKVPCYYAAWKCFCNSIGMLLLYFLLLHSLTPLLGLNTTYKHDQNTI